MAVSRTVIKKVPAVETDEGVGARVRRSIGTMDLRNLTPFLMLDHFHVSRGAGFPDHPHRGQATVTYMLQGSSRHEDSAGHAGTIETGGVQWMCAGKGIIHAEMPIHAPGVPEPRGLQLWIDLPKQFKMAASVQLWIWDSAPFRFANVTQEPSYQELGSASIPVAHPNGPQGSISVRVISGTSHGVDSPVRPLGGCWYFHVTMKKSGDTMFQDIPPGWTSFIYLWEGAIAIGDDGSVNDSFHTLVLSNRNGETGVSITATKDDTQFVLAAGEPLDQTVFQYGPFVMTTREEIQKTLVDYQTGTNGFEKAHTWQSKIGHSAQ